MAGDRAESIIKSVESSISTRLSTRKEVNKGAWTAEEDRKLAEVVAIHGAIRWQSIASKSGLNRSGKSCRLRWLNYLRPNIKRGNISDQEEDLILRLHKLLGNRWSLIAGRLPGRTDNQIKNYWNSHLSKKVKQMKEINQNYESSRSDKAIRRASQNIIQMEVNTDQDNLNKDLDDDFFDFSNEEPFNLEWITKFLQEAPVVSVFGDLRL